MAKKSASPETPVPAVPVPSETGDPVPPDGGETVTPGGGGNGSSPAITEADVAITAETGGGQPVEMDVAMIPMLRFTDAAEVRVHRGDGADVSIYSGDLSGTAQAYRGAMVTPPAGGWTKAAVNALTGRVGYATNVASAPYWDGLILEVAAGPALPVASSRRSRQKLLT